MKHIIKKFKQLLYGFVVLVIAAIAAINMNVTSKGSGLSDMKLANIEALAGYEISFGPLCIQHSDLCIEEPIDIDPYWYFTWPFKNLP